jgi:hypothetical protein
MWVSPHVLAFGAPYEYTKLVMSWELLINVNTFSMTSHLLRYKHTTAETFRTTHKQLQLPVCHWIKAFCRITLQQTVPTFAIDGILTDLHICATTTQPTNSQLTQHPSLHNHLLYTQMAGRILHFLPGIDEKFLKHCSNVSLTDTLT